MLWPFFHRVEDFWEFMRACHLLQPVDHVQLEGELPVGLTPPHHWHTHRGATRGLHTPFITTNYLHTPAIFTPSRHTICRYTSNQVIFLYSPRSAPAR